MATPAVDPTPANILWHTPELLTSILTFRRDSEPESRSWARDVGRVLSTSKFGLEIGAPVLYESESVFPRRSPDRFDMQEYLRDRGCSQSRLTFYLSHVKRLDRYSKHPKNDRRPLDTLPCTNFLDLKTWLQDMIEAYPNASTIDFHVTNVIASVVRNQSAPGFKEMSIMAAVDRGERRRDRERDSGETVIPTVYRRLCTQVGMASGQNLVPLTNLTLGEGADNYRSHSDELSIDGILDISNPRHPGATYANLITLDIRDYEIYWEQLSRLLAMTPKLKSLVLHVSEFGVINRTHFAADKVLPSLDSLDITLAGECFPDLPIVTSAFRQLKKLRITLPTGDMDRNILWKEFNDLEITSLEITGAGVEHNVLLTLLESCPKLTKLSASCFVGPNHWDASDSPMWDPDWGYLDCLRELCESLRSIKDLTLIGYTNEGFPILPAVDLLTSELPYLARLSLPVQLPSHRSLPRLLPIGARHPRWPSLRRLELKASIIAFEAQRPACLSVARLLVPCMSKDAEMLGRMASSRVDDWHSRDNEYVPPDLKQWWEDVFSTMEILKEDLVLTAGSAMPTPGWQMLDTSTIRDSAGKALPSKGSGSKEGGIEKMDS